MKKSKLSMVVAGLLLVSSAAMAQTATKKPETGDGVNPTLQRQDATSGSTSRAAVKSDMPQSAGPKETGDGQKAVKPDTTVGNNTRAEVKSDMGTAKTKVETGDGTRPKSTSANAAGASTSTGQSISAERKEKAKAKREAKMSAKEKSGTTTQ